VQLLQIKVTQSLFERLEQIAILRGCSNILSLVYQSLEATAADLAVLEKHRLQALKEKAEPAPLAAPRSNDFGDYHKSKLTPEKRQRILHLRESQNLTPGELAARFGVSKTCICLLLAQHQPVVTIPTRPHGGGRGPAFESSK